MDIVYLQHNTAISKGEIKGQYNATQLIIRQICSLQDLLFRVPLLSIFEILFPPLCPLVKLLEAVQ